MLNKKRNSEINKLLQETRDQLKNLYKTKISTKEKRSEKRRLFSLIQNNYSELKKSWGDYNAYDKWMSQELNNAHLLLIATYHDLVPTFKALLQKENNNLSKFYIAVEKLGKENKEERKSKLKQIAKIQL